MATNGDTYTVPLRRHMHLFFIFLLFHLNELVFRLKELEMLIKTFKRINILLKRNTHFYTCVCFEAVNCFELTVVNCIHICTNIST
jgi:hypothetical protein